MKPRDPWDDDLDILSAENVNFAVETAGLGSRFGAALIDIAMQVLILLLLSYAANLLLDYLPITTWTKWVQEFAKALSAVTVMAIIYGYGFFFEWLWDGQTPGKRWLGLRVLQTGGTPITAWEALVRSVLRTVDFLPLFYGVGAVVALINPYNRRIGDLVAGTIVARERHEASTKQVLDIDAAATAFLASCASPAAVTTSAANGQPVAAMNAAVASVTHPFRQQLTEQDIELVHEFFVRREKLKKDPRRRLAHSLASRLGARLGQAAPAEDLAERWLEELARVLFANPIP